MGSVASASPQLGTSIFVGTPVTSTPQTIKASAPTVWQVEIDCTANTGEDVYARFYNTVTPTVGTTQARMLLPGKAGSRATYTFPRSVTGFNSALSVACVQSPGAGAGAVNPSGTVKITVRFD